MYYLAVCGLLASRCGQAGRQCCRLLRGMGVWRLVGRGGVVGALLPRLVSTFITKAGNPQPCPHTQV